ncbi:MAG: undecaprenyl-diphosphate phosphatase [Pseudomonadota bacterium]|nr:undecaprenyl-diphosphate phosphatase [Pseudomonadota bacterium]
MESFALWIVALLQGLTEFLPISSSAHLILVPVLAGWEDQGLMFDVAVHLGTLLAVVVYFRHELARMLRDWLRSMIGRGMTADARLAWAVVLATIPVGLAALLADDWVETYLRSPTVIAWATIVFGLLLWWADRTGRGDRGEYGVTLRDVAVIGVAQALALIPGTSRSGITMTAGLAMGLSRTAAARFSFLLAVPVIVLAGGYEGAKLWADPSLFDWRALLVGGLISAVTAYLTIDFFLRLVERVGMLPFVVYRLLLGLLLLVVF